MARNRQFIYQPYLRRIQSRPLQNRVTTTRSVTNANNNRHRAIFFVTVDNRGQNNVQLHRRFTTDLTTTMEIIATRHFILTMQPRPFLINMSLINNRRRTDTRTASLTSHFRRIRHTRSITKVDTRQITVAFTRRQLHHRIRSSFQFDINSRFRRNTRITRITTLVISTLISSYRFGRTQFNQQVRNGATSFNTRTLRPRNRPATLRANIPNSRGPFTTPRYQTRSRYFRKTSPLYRDTSE